MKGVVDKAEAFGGESVIVSFWPHPRMVLDKAAQNLQYLTTLQEKRTLIEQQGIQHFFVIPFTYEFSRIPACEFVKEYLVERLGMRHLVFGFNHHFGKNREGNYENLRDCAERYGFSIEQIPPVYSGNDQVSSSLIREYLGKGMVEEANRLLGYPYFLEGKIVGGKQIGRIMGFPTANISPGDPHKLVPATGVYAVEVVISKEVFFGMMNIGFRPTLDRTGEGKTLEVHILNFEENVYNHDIQIRFVNRLRDEQNFNSMDELKSQLILDKARTLEILSNK
jgi:riboflavin kinase / FMN adenylyltransferase